MVLLNNWLDFQMADRHPRQTSPYERRKVFAGWPIAGPMGWMNGRMQSRLQIRKFQQQE